MEQKWGLFTLAKKKTHIKTFLIISYNNCSCKLVSEYHVSSKKQTKYWMSLVPENQFDFFFFSANDFTSQFSIHSTCWALISGTRTLTLSFSVFRVSVTPSPCSFTILRTGVDFSVKKKNKKKLEIAS